MRTLHWLRLPRALLLLSAGCRSSVSGPAGTPHLSGMLRSTLEYPVSPGTTPRFLLAIALALVAGAGADMAADADAARGEPLQPDAHLGGQAVRCGVELALARVRFPAVERTAQAEQRVRSQLAQSRRPAPGSTPHGARRAAQPSRRPGAARSSG